MRSRILFILSGTIFFAAVLFAFIRIDFLRDYVHAFRTRTPLADMAAHSSRAGIKRAPADSASPAGLKREKFTGTFRELIINRLQSLEIPQTEIRVKILKQDSAVDIRARIPRGKPIEFIVWQLSSSLQNTTYRLKDCYCPSDSFGCHLEFVSTIHPRVLVDLKYASRYFSQTARMAILIDDFGFEANQTTIEYLSFPEPLTVGLVPAKKLTVWTAQIANEYHKEIIILLPMEKLPKKSARYSPATIMLHYPEQKIRSILGSAIGSVPTFAGMSNYYGQEALSDSRIMSIVLTEAKKHKTFFILSRPGRKTAVPEVARKIDISYRTLDGALGEDLTIKQVQDTLHHFALIAQKSGAVLISSPASTAFISGLKQELPQLKQNGIKLVYVSDIVKISGVERQ